MPGPTSQSWPIRCIQAAVNLPFDEGLKFERTLFLELVAGTQSAAQRHIFFAERAAGSQGRAYPAPAKPVESAIVVGGGLMGAGIAYALTLSGLSVHVVETDAAGAARARANLDKLIAQGVDRGSIPDAAAFRVRLTVSAGYDDLPPVDLAIEAATENEETKKAIFRALQPHLKPETLLASNTSSISITRLASATDRPERFIGLHFMNPVPLMKLVEIIRGIATDAPTYETARQFAQSLGKSTSNSEDFPAFIVNRVLIPMINEAIYTLYEGVGTVDAIDTAMKLGANHPMGPLELGDFIGLDTVLSIMNVLHEGLADSKYRPCPLLVKYVEAGWLGKKAGRGFYDYRGETPVPTR